MLFRSIVKAVQTIDVCLHDVVEAAKEAGYDVLITADHGNADNAVNENGTPNTAHSLNPVPLVFVSDDKDAKIGNGSLADIAPTILNIMGVAVPAEMNGKNLIG